MESLLDWLLWLCCCQWCCQQSETSEVEEIESDSDKPVKQKYQSQIDTYKLNGKTLQDVIEDLGYEIYDKENLGKGGFGEVCKARDLKSGQEIACKKIDLNYNYDSSKKVSKNKFISDIMRQCEHEVWVTKLDHKNIIRIHDHFKIRDNFYLMMELSIVGCVQKEMERRKKAYSERIAKHYFNNILSGLDYLHSNGIVHHDLKLDNFLIFLTSDDNDKSKNVIKICDFGISFVGFDQNKGFLKKRANRGTVLYMAPEVLIKNMQLKHRQYQYIYESTVKSCGYKVNNPFKTDIWSLGVCLYQLVCYHYPFKYKKGKDSRETCQHKTDLLIQQINDRYRWPKWIYNPNHIKKTEHLRHLRTLIRSLINKDANCRPYTTGIKSYEWISDDNVKTDSE